jgi:hypothetical protein
LHILPLPLLGDKGLDSGRITCYSQFGVPGTPDAG